MSEPVLPMRRARTRFIPAAFPVHASIGPGETPLLFRVEIVLNRFDSRPRPRRQAGQRRTAVHDCDLELVGPQRDFGFHPNRLIWRLNFRSGPRSR